MASHLTDTTEAGMSALAAELAQANRGSVGESGVPRHRPEAREGCRANGERISSCGTGILSESEVRLHLALSGRDH
jgi:hypothetical protein